MREAVSKIDVVVYALAILGGAETVVHSEDIAAKCYELSSSRFSWTLPRYSMKGWPDKYVVRNALVDARKAKYGRLVEGVTRRDPVRDGWRLTPSGAEWYLRERDRLEAALHLDTPDLPQGETDRFLRSVRAESLFRTYVRTGSLEGATRYAFTDMLKCSPDASRELVARKFARLTTVANLVRDADVLCFLEACRSAFAEVLEDQHAGGR